MKFPYSQKILLWPVFASLTKKSRKGTMTLITAFLFFIFSALGLSLIYLSQIHLKTSGFKKNSTLIEYAAENGIKQGFNNLLSLLAEAPSPAVLSPEEFNELRENARSHGTKIIEEFLGLKLPFLISDSWEKLSWKSSMNCTLERIVEEENYFRSMYKISIDSEGMLHNLVPKRKSTLSASLGILAGQLPLPSLPFLVDKKLKLEEKANFTEKNKISLSPSKKNYIQPEISFSEEKLIPEEANSLLSKAFKTKFFHPQNLSSSKLREILGLEKSEEPVPDGVYLIKDSTGLGGVYVQGDVDEMILAIEDGFQVISFRIQLESWILKYSPSKIKTFFASPDKISSYDLISLGIIIINGKVKSLGGGVVDSIGQVAMVKDEEIPSILQGIQLTIISSDRITLSSHLIRQGIKWQEGIPYAEDSTSQLMIFSAGKDIWDKTATDGGITIDESSPEEIKVHASLTASGKGFSIEGEGKKVQILGSLQATDYVSQENTLKIIFDDQVLDENNASRNVPVTAKPILYIFSFRALDWEEF
jgi:hypothetical protein